MEKKDVMYVVIAICILLVMALVIKPIMTGKPVGTGISGSPTSQPIPVNVTSNYSWVTSQVTTPKIAVATSIPTPVPTITVKNISFVNPATYGISMDNALPNGTPINSVTEDTNLTLFATITGQYSGTTQVFHIPFPYWELVYTVEPTKAPTTSVYKGVTPKSGAEQPSSVGGMQGSYSTLKAEFIITVIDADNPTGIVRTITPPGGIDLDFWTGKKSTNPTPATTTPKYSTVTKVETPKPIDPRPWTEKFYEGGKNYFFIIKAQALDSYKVDIYIPTRYIGKY